MQQPELYIGLMSGTSLDGIDAVLVDFSQAQPRLLAKHYQPFDDALKNDLLALHLPARNELHQAQLTGNQLARLYASAVNTLLGKTTSSNTNIRAIGCHGQTIRHCPEHGYTLQIGNAALLAELTGITVVSDFRSRDIAAGGQGAPLVPAFHDQVLRHPGIHRVIVNIGGISNLTNLPPDAATSDKSPHNPGLSGEVAAAIDETTSHSTRLPKNGSLVAGYPAPDAHAHRVMAATTGFDCGPGNLLMDAWCMQHIGKPYDENGAWAASGQALPALLEQMLNEAFFALPPPKSTGRDLFNMAWLNGKLQNNERAEDVQATLLELTCVSIAQAIRKHCDGTTEIYLCGGGARNQTLRNRLTALLPGSRVQTTDTIGVDSDYLEALAFAWLAQQTLQGKPANLPRVTGAKHPCILGAIYRN
ncbi:MAG: anhydro-N-acetylmuramic acid kinase [Gallionella sp.]|nr:anhydro-N-acetylmuramic acid kinase [Gallionella sp.]